ncbi:hypothetical protein [Mycoplasmopsis bovirhinis]|uniref:Uncharacterized protein n=1 Tax=Mycoplasmopsis bovirhinis TaxID=29553 RepID=A0A449AF10_9BACT|nr:hypothetical protein [Mycoplasmopsis bovirhinis]VEU63581.1 Uncharacterised protein [Mycoplasmopsis bovirhinis]
MQGALETQRKLRTSQIDLEQLYNILQELSGGFSIQEVAKIFDRDVLNWEIFSDGFTFPNHTIWLSQTECFKSGQKS